MVSSPPPRRATPLATAVAAALAAALAVAGALLVAAVLLVGLSAISVDQPPQARELIGWGSRWAGVLAVALGSGAVLGPAPPASPRAAARVLGITAAAVLALCVGAAALAILAVRLGLWGHDWGLPHRSGHAARLVVLPVARISGLPAAALAGWCLARRRRGRRHG